MQSGYSMIGIAIIVSTILGMLLAFSLDHYIFPGLLSSSSTPETTTTTQPYLVPEEGVVIHSSSSVSTIEDDIVLPIKPVLFEYVEVIDGCGTHFEGECLNARGGPGTDFPVVYQLRNGIILKVGGKVERDGEVWYQIVFDEYIRYPERLKGDWYVHGDYVKILYAEGNKSLTADTPTTSAKRIVVDRSEQVLRAFEGDEIVIETPISTGLQLTPTPRGTFTVFKKMPSRYMQGPLPGLADQQPYDLPGVPWNLYFTEGGAVIHGAYWHSSFGSQYSHGCVNVPLTIARDIYDWAELGTKIIVQD